MNRSLQWLFAGAVATLLGYYYLKVADILLLPRVGLQPWLMRNGLRCFGDIVDQHEAGLPLVLSMLFPAFSDPVLLAQSALAGLAATSVLLVQAAAPPRWAPAGVLFFACWVPVVWNGRLWYETALAPLYLAAYLAWPGDPGVRRGRVLASGLLLGGAVVVKQYAWLMVVVHLLGAALMAPAERRGGRWLLQDLFPFAVGLAVLVAAYLAYIASTGSLADYVFWAWGNNFGSYRVQAAKPPSWYQLLLCSALLLPAVGLLCSSALAWRRGVAGAGRSALLALLALAATATVYPRFEVFHVGAALPLLAVAFAAAADWAIRSRRASPPAPPHPGGRPLVLVPLALSTVLSIGLLLPHAQRLARAGVPRVSWYSELVPLAERVRELTRAEDPILVFPDVEPTANLYLLSQRLPPGIWAYTYPWYASQEVMQRIVRAMEERRPPIVVYFPSQGVDGVAAEDYAAPLASYILQHYTTRETHPTAVGTARIMTRNDG